METKLAGVLDAIFLGSPTAIAMTKSSFLGANDLLLDERQVADAGARRLDAARTRQKARKARPPSARSARRRGIKPAHPNV